MRGSVGRPPEHSLFSRQRTSSVERELASTPYAFTPKPIRPDDPIDIIQRAKESLLNPFEDDINVRLAKQRLFGRTTPEPFPAGDEVESKNSGDDAVSQDSLPAGHLIPSSPRDLSRGNSEEQNPYPTAPEVLPPIRAEVTHLSSYQRSRAIARANTEKFYKKIAIKPEPVRRGDDFRSKSQNNNVSKDSSDISDAMNDIREGAFTVLPGAMSNNEDLESNSSEPSFKVTPTVRSHKVSSFAIVADQVPAGPPQSLQESEVPAGVDAPSITSSVGKASSSGRVSPFRGKGFKVDPYSRHTTPKTSTTTSPQRSRSNSITRQASVSFERPVTPPRNYIRENIQEVHELSNFNRERNEELAQQRKMEEELEILKELGVISDGAILKVGTTPKAERRMKSVSPSAVVYYEDVRSAREKYEQEKHTWKPPLGRFTMRNMSKSQPQSKSGSPQHHSKIPKRQTSVSPPRTIQRFIQEPPSKMSNAISPDGRFISNSTGSIYDNRVFSVIVDDDNNPIYADHPKSKSRSTQNLDTPASILKSKPPKSPGNLGPPPTTKSIGSKRLSPIASTPDKSTAQNTPAKKGMKSKTPTPRVSSPSKLPKRPSKSLAASPVTSRAPSKSPSRSTSRAPSRAPSRASSRNNINETGNLQKASSTPKLDRNSRQKSITSIYSSNSKKDNSYSSSNSVNNPSIGSRRDSNGKPVLTRMSSRTSVTSKASDGSKPELKRNNSRTSLLSRRDSMKSINEKPNILERTLKQKSTLKNWKEKSIVENPNERGSRGRQVNKRDVRDVSTSRSTNGEIEIPKQDNETQYDKLSQSESNVDRLIPLTKGNVVSMTTAAITSQPLEIAAKVTSQLPSALERAREKAIFDRNSSSDSIAAKNILEPSSNKADSENESSQKAEDKTKLQKTASKNSLGSVKEEKETVTKGGTIIQNNMKLIPLDKSNLDPQVEKVRKKIDNILNSDQSSIVDLKERVERDEKIAAEKVNKTLEKVAEKMEEEVKVTTTTAVIEKAEEKKPRAEEKKMDTPQSIKKQQTPPAEVKSEKTLTPVEKPKMENNKLDVKPAPNEVKAQIITVKESAMKKDTLVNEKGLGSPVDDVERVTEAVIRGEPDVEVQSGNVSPAVMNMAGNRSPKPSTSMTNGASNGASVHAKLPHNDSKGSDTLKPASKGILGSPVSGNPKDEIDVEKATPDGKPENFCKRFLGGCACCGKKQNQSKVHLINEKDKKKGAKELNAKPEDQSKKGFASKLNCFKKKGSEGDMVNINNVRLSSDRIPNDKAEDKKTSGCLGCCSRKNKIRDSSADRRAMAMAPVKWYKRMICCKSKKKKQQDWAARRDSILSQPNAPETGCCAKLNCCRKKAKNPAEDSRRTSLFSKKRSLSQAVPVEDTRSKLDPTLIEHNSAIRGAIPALPVPLAWMCFGCNIIIPGLGTLLSGIFCLCFGRPRFGVYDGYRPRIGAFLIDIFVGAGQLFTVLFCLVGWGWSIWWGSMMVRVAKKYKKFKLAEEDPEKAVAATNNHRTART